jgi:flavin reductase (DIM6/NTAB) family NADH-FMN oxidoreductase RutF
MPGPAAFEKVAARLNYPMFVVTAAAGEDLAGCLVGFTTQCSINPLRYLLCISDKNHTFQVAERATHLVAHLLAPDDRDLAELFGGETEDEVDKFSRCEWRPGPGGTPILTDAAAWFGGPIQTRWSGGDHTGHVITVTDAYDSGADRFLGFSDLASIDPGHEP